MTISNRITVRAAVLALALPLLSACGNSADNNATSSAPAKASQPVSPLTTAEKAPASDAMSTESTESAGATDSSESEVPQGDSTDPVIIALDAFLKSHAGVTVVDVDREDHADVVVVKVLETDALKEYQVTPDGMATEVPTNDTTNDDDVAKAKTAKVTALDAAKQARHKQQQGAIDEIDLEDNGGTLSWKVAFDDANGNTVAQELVPAQ
ncbi:MAG: hypothetical protein Q4A82_00340 [Corynebacterium sp.]|nr:hypothetical protein [Corynebacterium sp.]